MLGDRDDATLELRYSGRCTTAWARITINHDTCKPADRDCARAEIVRNSDGQRYDCATEQSADLKTCHTAQVNDNGVTSYAEGWMDRSAVVYHGRTGSY